MSTSSFLFPEDRSELVEIRDVGLEVDYWSGFIDESQGTTYLNTLLNETVWHQPELWMFGRRVKIPRLTSWFGDENVSYVYSGIRNVPQPWTVPLDEIRKLVENKVGQAFNSVLLNLYRDGSDHLSWHKDDERELGSNPKIASISLGAERIFALRSTSQNARRLNYELILEHGSLMYMAGETQSCWAHCIKRQPKISASRINLTFRRVEL
jgi:alkylated DNA repair dioxygenase AlkB